MTQRGVKTVLLAIAMLFVAITSTMLEHDVPTHSFGRQYIGSSNGEMEDFESYPVGGDVNSIYWQVGDAYGCYLRCVDVGGDKRARLLDTNDRYDMFAWYGIVNELALFDVGDWVEVKLAITSIVSNDFFIKFIDPDENMFAYMTFNTDKSYVFVANDTTSGYIWNSGIEFTIRITVYDDDTFYFQINEDEPILQDSIWASFYNQLSIVTFETGEVYDDADVVITYIDAGDATVDLLPNASFLANETTIDEGDSVIFTHTGVDGDPLTMYQWNFGDGSANATTENVTHVYSIAGSYDVILTITDADGDIDVERKVGYITVAVDLLPDATFTSNATTILEGDTVQFNFTGSIGDAPCTFLWEFGDGFNSSAENPVHRYTTAGWYSINLNVSDNDGDTSLENKSSYIHVGFSIMADFYVKGLPRVYDAGIRYTFLFDGVASLLPSTYAWTFGDGGFSSGVTVTHKYQQAGTYTVTMLVTDSVGHADSYSKVIVIRDTAGPVNPDPDSPVKIIPLSAGWMGLLVGGMAVVTIASIYYITRKSSMHHRRGKK